MDQLSRAAMASVLPKEVPAGSWVLDVGSMDVNGTYRTLFDADVNYVGLDIAEGPNVDVVVADPYNWKELHRRDGPDEYDLIISGSTLEHIKWPWKTMVEIDYWLKPGGRVYVVVPAMWPEHKHPVDCYRFLPDGMRALGEWADLNTISATLLQGDNPSEAITVAVYEKGKG